MYSEISLSVKTPKETSLSVMYIPEPTLESKALYAKHLLSAMQSMVHYLTSEKHGVIEGRYSIAMLGTEAVFGKKHSSRSFYLDVPAHASNETFLASLENLFMPLFLSEMELITGVPLRAPVKEETNVTG